MSVEINELYNELCEKYAATATELEYYKDKAIPKYNVGDKLHALNIKEKKIIKLVVDEIITNRFGIHYREYLNETELQQYPEQYCFDNILDAEISLKNLH